MKNLTVTFKVTSTKKPREEVHSEIQRLLVNNILIKTGLKAAGINVTHIETTED